MDHLPFIRNSLEYFSEIVVDEEWVGISEVTVSLIFQCNICIMNYSHLTLSIFEKQKLLFST